MTRIHVNDLDIPQTLAVTDEMLRARRDSELDSICRLVRDGGGKGYSVTLFLSTAELCERAVAGDLLARNQMAACFALEENRSDIDLAGERLRIIEAKVAAVVAGHRKPRVEEGHDPVDRPAHYDGDACMRSIESDGHGLAFCLGSAKKYLWRKGLKHPRVREDIAKAQWYLERALSGPVPDHERRRITDYEQMCAEVLSAMDSNSTLPDLRPRLSDHASFVRPSGVEPASPSRISVADRQRLIMELRNAVVGSVCTTTSGLRFVLVEGGAWRVLGKNGKPRMNVAGFAALDLSDKVARVDPPGA